MHGTRQDEIAWDKQNPEHGNQTHAALPALVLDGSTRCLCGLQHLAILRGAAEEKDMKSLASGYSEGSFNSAIFSNTSKMMSEVHIGFQWRL